MIDPVCVIEVGVHPGPYWKSKSTKLVVCSRHKSQYEELGVDLGIFDWEEFIP